MKKTLSILADYLRKSDSFLLSLCLISSIFGTVVISSATNHLGSEKQVYVQIAAIIFGLVLYFLFSVIDIETISEKWKFLLIVSVLLISSLFVFGIEDKTGNRAWLRFAGIGIQPAEIVKIIFIILVAKLLDYQSKTRGVNHIISILLLAGLFLLYFGLIMFSSSDLGSALVYFFIFAVILFAGGLKIYWFLIAAVGFASISPVIWNNFLTQRQRDRILAPYDSTIDPSGLGITYQPNRSKSAIASGRIFGMGLGNGVQTQSGDIPEQDTDFIFAVIGEELGMIGCLAVIILLTLIIVRCIYIGTKSQSHLGSLVCFGVAGMIIFQTFENIGMCIGIAPVIGLTLPFFSSGGSSIVTTFAAIGLVSGVKLSHCKRDRILRRY